MSRSAHRSWHPGPAVTGIPVGDALIVLRGNGPGVAVCGIHGPTAVVMPAISVLLLVA